MKFNIIAFLLLLSSNVIGSQSIEFTPHISGIEPKIVTLQQQNGSIQFEIRSGSGTLQSAQSVNGPWTSVGGVTAGVAPNEETKFLRLTREREFNSFRRFPSRLYIPDNYNGEKPLPLIVRLHHLVIAFIPNLENLSEETEKYIPLRHLVDSEEFLYLTPRGLFGTGFDGRGFYWNASDQCCQNTERDNRLFLDDNAHIRSAIEWVIENYNVDTNRIMTFGTGAAGGTMANEFACTNSDLVAGSISWGSLHWIDPVECSPRYPFHHLHIHSLTDDINDYQGGEIWQGISKISGQRLAFTTKPVMTEFSNWANRFGCGNLGEWELSVFKSNIGAPGPDTDIIKYSGCDSNVILEHWRVKTANHLFDIGNGDKSELDNRIISWAKSHPKLSLTDQ